MPGITDMIMHNNFFILTILCIFCIGCAAIPIIDGEITELNGRIYHHGWEKSLDSYCSQGSDYFMLDDSIVLKYDKRLLQHINKSVTLKGKYIKREVECPTGSQCPLTPDGGPFKCVLFEIKSIQ